MDKEQILLQAPNVQISILPQYPQVIVAQWHGYQRLDLIQQGCMVMEDTIRHQGCLLILNDLQALKGTIAMAQDWLNHEWLPQMIRLGLKATAYVYSPDLFAKMSLQRMFAKRNLSNYSYDAFDDIDTAWAWLAQFGAVSASLEPEEA